MRRIGIWFATTAVIVVLLFAYHTSTSGPKSTSTVVSGPQAPGVVGAGTPAPTRSGATRAPGAADTTVNGTVAQTRWGPVQVQVHISKGKIVDVVTLVQPNGNGRDQVINGYALPQLRQQVLRAQSANIDGVSGATVTSDGYRESLQAALDAAHFGG